MYEMLTFICLKAKLTLLASAHGRDYYSYINQTLDTSMQRHVPLITCQDLNIQHIPGFIFFFLLYRTFSFHFHFLYSLSLEMNVKQHIFVCLIIYLINYNHISLFTNLWQGTIRPIVIVDLKKSGLYEIMTVKLIFKVQCNSPWVPGINKHTWAQSSIWENIYLVVQKIEFLLLHSNIFHLQYYE